MHLRTGALSSGVILSAFLAACTGGSMEESVSDVSSAVRAHGHERCEGKDLFNNPVPGTNGRSCATCHVASDHFGLTPEHVAAVFAEDPNDPLFNPIDADDPAAANPTYDHLKAGLVRVTLKLADNLDVIDADGNVITNADRTIWVWRAVPSIENVGYTAPYQYDGRALTLQDQALGALQGHSEIDHEPSEEELDQIAEFESKVFSSHKARLVANALEDGHHLPPLDFHFPPGSDEAKGQVLYQNICAKCHGGPGTNVVVDQATLATFFPKQHADGTIDIAYFLPTGVAMPTNFRTDLGPPHMGTYGIAPLGTLRELGALPNPSGLSAPHYRIRFYTDASRTQKLVDMPPPPPAIGPSLVPEPFSIDPGRAIISGDPYDWEGFDVPQLRSVAHTAPYFHDNSAPDLQAVLDIYSRLILPAGPSLNVPPVFPPEGPGLPPESLSPEQKAQLLAFLQKL